jgi:hypothetical protein
MTAPSARDFTEYYRAPEDSITCLKAGTADTAAALDTARMIAKKDYGEYRECRDRHISDLPASWLPPPPTRD